MSKILRKIICLSVCCLLTCTFVISANGIASVSTLFDKYEIVSTPDRIPAGADPENLIVYGAADSVYSAYGIEKDEKLFDLDPLWKSVAPYKKGAAVVTDAEGRAVAIINKKGKTEARLTEGYRYNSEYANGLICLVDDSASENGYVLITRKGKTAADHFYEVCGEIAGEKVLIREPGGDFATVNKEGKKESINLTYLARTEDGISFKNGVHIGSEGNVLAADGKQIFENKGYGKLSPIDKRTVLAALDGKVYFTDIKSGAQTELEGGAELGEFLYTSGEVQNGAVFVGNTEKGFLYEIKTGKKISTAVSEFSGFSGDYAGVKLENGKYGIMKTDGKLVTEGFDYISNTANGFAVGVKNGESETAVFVICPEKTEEEVFTAKLFDDLSASGNKVTLSAGADTLSVVKTDNGNVYIKTDEGEGVILAHKKENDPKTAIILVIISLFAVLVVAVSLGDYAKRKRK